MVNKTVVAIVAAVVVVSAFAGVLFINGSKGSGDTDIDIEGKWVLTYFEQVDLVDNDHKPIMKASDCYMFSQIFDPKHSPMTMEITSFSDNFFSGKINDVDIHGTRNDNRFSFEEITDSSNTHMYIGMGAIHKDYLGLAFYQHQLGADRQVCCAGYAMFIPEGADSPYPSKDRVDYNLDFEPVKATLFKMEDLSNPMAIEGGAIKYAKSNTMVSLFDIEGKSVVGGVQVLISMGKYNGNAMGIVTGNLDVGHGVIAFSGRSEMADGKLYCSQVLHENNVQRVAQMTFNVKYDSGKLLPITYLEKQYKGTVTIWDSEDEPTEGEITKTVTSIGNVVYAYEEFNGVKYKWFGVKYSGNIIQFMVMADNLRGSIFGNIQDDGSIVLKGFLYGPGGVSYAYEYEMEPVTE